MNAFRLLSAIALVVLSTAITCGQQRGDRGDRDRGGDRGGDRGRGDDRGRGGPPWARGGGSPWSRGGSPWGGGRGGRGGFNPSDMIKRFDSNGNGVIDPDEQQGPVGMMISRMQQFDSSIKPGRPIPIKKITEGFEKMRSGWDRGRRDRGRGEDFSDAADAALESDLLVPGFGSEIAQSPLLGFGAAAELLSVEVTEADEREAAERMRRYDRNKDGFISKNELSSRFAGNPMDFDRNRDGKLSVGELAVRYARRREGQEEAKREARSERRDDRRDRDGEKGRDKEIDTFGGRKSYAVQDSRKNPEGLPGFFTDKDANEDGQVTMAEFSTEWTDQVVAEFFDNDFNRDGVITTEEAIRAVEGGGASAERQEQATARRSRSTSKSSSSRSRSSSSRSSKPKSGSTDDKYFKTAERIVKRNDKNGDNVLTVSEWSEMLMSPADSDANRDGRVTIEEYAQWMRARQRRRGK